MSILPIQLTRISDLLRSSVADQSINATQQQLIQIQNELSTGKAVNQPSDNPGAAATILALNRSLSLNQQYSNNAASAQTQLGVVSSALTGLSNLLNNAQGIASSDVNTEVDQSQRDADAQVINSLISEAQTYANTESNGVYLFGGQNSSQQPYVSVAGGVQYVGSNSVLQTQADNGLLLPTEVSGQSVFGGLSSQVVGTPDLTPDITAQTQLSSLGGATNEGVNLGSFQLSNGTTSATIDLSSAQTLGDVVTAINSAGVGGITASLGTNGIVLSGTSGDNITVTDTGGGNTAAELGIATSPSGAGTGNSVNGSALNPQITNFTPLSNLRGGQGIDSTGFILTSNGVSKTIGIPSGGDVQSLLNEINGSGLGVVASINSAGNGINVQSNIQGVTMTIGEDGGTTATDLGIRSFSPSTELSSLNNGQGVGTAAAGTNGDFTVTAADGSSFNVSIAGAQTVQDVIGDINSAATLAGVNVSANFATTGNGIVLTDGTTGSGTLSVAAINASTAASDLGLTTPASGNTITGSDVNGVQTSGIFSDLQALATALKNGDTSAITAAAENLKTDGDNVSQANGVAGATSDEYQNLSSQLQDQNTATQTFLSNVQDANMTQAISQFQTLQTALQAALETTATSQSLTLLNFLT